MKITTPPAQLRVATYNIHKGVQGVGPRRRLEIHNLGHAVELLDADFICLQEVRLNNRREAQHFSHWPHLPQAQFLAPLGYETVYTTNAITRHGEHGNALLSRWPVVRHRHEDMSDHRLEQRGLLHVELDVAGHTVHVIVVHLGLVPASRVRQVMQLCRYVEREIGLGPRLVIAGDFNDQGVALARMLGAIGCLSSEGPRVPTFPSRLPLVQLDHVYARGLRPATQHVPRGRSWARMSDHLPLVVDLEFPTG